MLGTLRPDGPGPSPLPMLPSMESGLEAERSRNEGGRPEGVAVGTKFCKPVSAPDMLDMSCCKVSGERSASDVACCAASVNSSLISMISGMAPSDFTECGSSEGAASATGWDSCGMEVSSELSDA